MLKVTLDFNYFSPTIKLEFKNRPLIYDQNYTSKVKKSGQSTEMQVEIFSRRHFR